ncbi:zf-HC2 domain-containing protein [Paludifilum halophilum]|uniref:Anti-sigma-W factor RsiW n=1 Tax=Paludifilum halophilum TaxID=1642702 RepID=A0A235B6Y2_9BACL|nr:zf-HC2 domain-containing protein [Paludifilum halophilum]OYD07637.1 hypothetical protein CHM34_09145 [Paludifilum halophilum]
MNCETVQEWIQRDMDNELNPREEEALYEHLADCPDCMKKYDAMKRISWELERLPRVSPPAGLVDELLPHLEQPSPDREGSSKKAEPELWNKKVRWWWIGAAGTAASLLMAIWLVPIFPSEWETSSVPSSTKPAQESGPDPSEKGTGTIQSNETGLPESDQKGKSDSPSGDSTASPSGQFLAAVEGNRVVVRDQGEEVYRSSSWKPASDVKLEWRSDRSLRVEIHRKSKSGERSGEVLLIDPVSGEEIQQPLGEQTGG